MKISINAVSENLSQYLETLYEYNFEETNANVQYIEEGYITLNDLEVLADFITDMKKHFDRWEPQFILSNKNNQMHLCIYDDWNE